MEPVAVVVLVVVLLVAVVILGLRRRPRQDDGMQTFRRHIDALSPEARREVMDRARRHDERGRSAGPAAIPGMVHGSDPREPGTRGPSDAADAQGTADGHVSGETGD